MPASSYKNISVFIKAAIIIAALAFIFKRVVNTSSTVSLLNIDFFAGNNIITSILAVALMPVNYLLEAIKWKLILKKVETISLTKSIHSVLMGLCTGVFTPNRSGECIGRAINISAENRLPAFGLTMVLSLIQTVITFTFGIISFFAVGNHIPSISLSMSLKQSLFFFIAILIITIIAAFILLFTQRGKEFVSKYLSLITSTFGTLKKSVQSSIWPLTILSCLRFIIFSIQYILLLRLFGVSPGPIITFGLVAITFMLVTIVPTAFISELPVRTSVAVFIIGFSVNNPAGIMAASLSLWIINLAIPALFGVYFLSRHKV